MVYDEMNNPKIKTSTCAYCQKTFKTVSWERLFCSRTCRLLVHNFDTRLKEFKNKHALITSDTNAVYKALLKHKGLSEAELYLKCVEGDCLSRNDRKQRTMEEVK